MKAAHVSNKRPSGTDLATMQRGVMRFSPIHTDHRRSPPSYQNNIFVPPHGHAPSVQPSHQSAPRRRNWGRPTPTFNGYQNNAQPTYHPARSSPTYIPPHALHRTPASVQPDVTKSSFQMSKEKEYDYDTDCENEKHHEVPDGVPSVSIKEEEGVFGEDTDDESDMERKPRAQDTLETTNPQESANLESLTNEHVAELAKAPKCNNKEGTCKSKGEESDYWDENKLEPIDDQSLADQDKYTYAWCEGNIESRSALTIMLLPYERYIFWRKLLRCETWGEIRAICDKELYETMVEKYRKNQKFGPDYGPLFKPLDDNWTELDDDEPVTVEEDFYFDECGEDFGLSAQFPPYIEVLQYNEATDEKHKWMMDFAEHEESRWSECDWITFEHKKKDDMLRKIEDMGCTAKYCPKLNKELRSMCE